MKTVAVISGGNSPEHTISMISAKYVLSSAPREEYKVIWVVASRKHQWFMVPEDQFETLADVDQAVGLKEVLWTHKGLVCEGHVISVDVAFPVMHGSYGEEGHLQGFLSMLAIPFTGSDVLGSAICMHKHIFKQVMQAHDIPTLPYLNISCASFSYEQACDILKTTKLFVKPSCAGSSYGASAVEASSAWVSAIENALIYSDNVIVEPYLLKTREIECAVWLDTDLASTLGEISTDNGFYDYENKYVNTTHSKLIAPALLDDHETAVIQAIAKKACLYAGVRQFARVDFFKHESNIYLNEINSLPGLTPISMFPRLLALDGFSASYWIGKMLKVALER